MAKMKYKMSSRATILLGRESVSRVDGAIIELVKNTYDADAGFCCLCFDVEHDQIYILDNGVGMTKETIETCWMLIGTDNKRVEYLSTKKRIKSGEKGIGRFALDRLGSKCRMYTKHDGEDLICWETDWSNFEKSGQVIDDVEADFAYCAGQRFEDIIPEKIKNAVAKFAEEAEDDQFTLSRGTLFIISSDAEKLAEAVQIFQEEREELISEIKLLRALATNGLMTTTMVHDLKSINALLVSRVRGFRLAIKQNDTPQIQRNLDDLKTNDEFLKSWMWTSSIAREKSWKPA